MLHFPITHEQDPKAPKFPCLEQSLPPHPDGEIQYSLSETYDLILGGPDSHPGRTSGLLVAVCCGRPPSGCWPTSPLAHQWVYNLQPLVTFLPQLLVVVSMIEALNITSFGTVS